MGSRVLATAKNHSIQRKGTGLARTLSRRWSTETKPRRSINSIRRL